MNLKNIISEDLKIPVSIIEEALNSSRKIVKHIKLKKKNGGLRTVYQPSNKLKTIQYWLVHNVFCEMQISCSAKAYIKNSGIKENAAFHSDMRYFLKLDFTDFFPSITSKDFYKILKQWHAEKNPIWQYNSENRKIFRLSCFYKDNKLPIGYPSSPIISNIVMYEFDQQLISTLNTNVAKYGNTKYTRYADDIIVSTDKKGACNEIFKTIKKQIADTKSPVLKLNTKKTHFASSSGGTAFVTGLRVCHDGHLTLHRKYKDKVRLLITLHGKGKLKDKDILKLRGHLNYIKHVDSNFYTKLQKKSFKIIKNIK
jgi:RNA-directed DNA polymerase